MKKKITTFMAAVLTAGCFSVPGYAADFSDLDEVPWDGAKNYIQTVSDLGLMVGDIHPVTGKERFRPAARVSYCEATQLAYMVLKQTNNLKPNTENLTDKWKATMEKNNIPEWAYDSISYALENKIISTNDVARFVTKSGDEFISNYASRESVAVIFGKALSHLYTLNSSPALKFADASTIASTSAPYIELLTNLGILSADEQNNFNPRTFINRSQIAVIGSKTYDVLSAKAKEEPTQTNKQPSKTITPATPIAPNVPKEPNTPTQPNEPNEPKTQKEPNVPNEPNSPVAETESDANLSVASADTETTENIDIKKNSDQTELAEQPATPEPTDNKQDTADNNTTQAQQNTPVDTNNNTIQAQQNTQQTDQTQEDTTASFAQEVIRLINEERTKLSLPALSLNTLLQESAQIRAVELEEDFSHTRPDGSDPSDLLAEKQIPYGTMGENIAHGQKTPEEVVKDWMSSQGHKENILSQNFKYIGVGSFKGSDGSIYWVQLFTD